MVAMAHTFDVIVRGGSVVTPSRGEAMRFIEAM